MLHGAGFCFMFAPRYHPAMRNVGPVRRELGVRTIFNVLGPLTNPARATHQVVGVARAELVETLGEVLRALGVRSGAVVHAQNGLDEIAGDAPTHIYSFDENGGRVWTLDPSDLGVDVPLRAIVAESVDECREAFFSVLSGEERPASNVVALNAAVALVAAGSHSKLADAFEHAKSVLASGAALRTFERAKELASDG